MNIPTDWADRIWRDAHNGLQIELEYQVEGHNSRHRYSRRGKLFRTVTGRVFFQPEDWLEGQPSNHDRGGFSWASVQSQAPAKPRGAINRWRVQPNTISVPVDASVTNTPSASTKENDMFLITTVQLIDGTAGQIKEKDTGLIVWQSEPFQDIEDKKTGNVTTAFDQATQAAEDKRREVLKKLFS